MTAVVYPAGFPEEWKAQGLKPFFYRAIYIDCPWRFSGGTKGRPQHYKRMTDVELAAMPIWMLAHPEGCHVFAWITSPMFERALAIIKQWNPSGALVKDCIRYSGRAFIWIKTHKRLRNLGASLFVHPGSLHKGMGYTIRKCGEDVWLFKYRKPKRKSKNVEEIIFDPVREHSRKPDEIYERIEAYCDGPYVEIFSRGGRQGWAAFGDEVGKFTKKAA